MLCRWPRLAFSSHPVVPRRDLSCPARLGLGLGLSSVFSGHYGQEGMTLQHLSRVLTLMNHVLAPGKRRFFCQAGFRSSHSLMWKVV